MSTAPRTLNHVGFLVVNAKVVHAVQMSFAARVHAMYRNLLGEANTQDVIEEATAPKMHPDPEG